MNDVAGHGAQAAPSGHGVGGSSEPLADLPVDAATVSRDVAFSGHIFEIVREGFGLPGIDRVISRDFVHHPGAVAIVALDDRGRVLLQRQRRQPVRAELWEIPAGLLDIDGETAIDTAARELYEEADLTATRWDVLSDCYNSPGCSDEAMRIFLARELSEVPSSERFERTDEEAGMPLVWLPLEEAVRAAMDGRISNSTSVIGLLAVGHAAASDFTMLRPVDAPWPARPTAQSPAGTTGPSLEGVGALRRAAMDALAELSGEGRPSQQS